MAGWQKQQWGAPPLPPPAGMLLSDGYSGTFCPAAAFEAGLLTGFVASEQSRCRMAAAMWWCG